MFWLVCVLGESGILLFAGKSWLPKTRVFTRKQIKTCDLSLKNFFFSHGGGGRSFQLLSYQKSFKISHLFIHVQSSSLPKHTQGIKSGFLNILKYNTSQMTCWVLCPKFSSFYEKSNTYWAKQVGTPAPRWSFLDLRQSLVLGMFCQYY